MLLRGVNTRGRAQQSYRCLGQVAETTLSLPPDELLDLDEALGQLERLEPEVARLVQLRLYAGLKNIASLESLRLLVVREGQSFVARRCVRG